MKTKTIFFGALVFLCGAIAFAASTFSRSAFRITGITGSAGYATAAATTPNSVVMTASFERRYTNDSDAADSEESATKRAVSFDLLAAPATQTTVTVGGGATVTDAQLAALIRKRSENAAGL